MLGQQPGEAPVFNIADMLGKIKDIDWGTIAPAIVGAGMPGGAMAANEMRKERVKKESEATTLLASLMEKGYVPIDTPFKQGFKDFLVRPGADLTAERIPGAVDLPSPILEGTGPNKKGYQYFKKLPNTSELDMLKYYLDKTKVEETTRHNRATEAARRTLTINYNARLGDQKWRAAWAEAGKRVTGDLSLLGASADEAFAIQYDIADQIYSAQLGKKQRPTKTTPTTKAEPTISPNLTKGLSLETTNPEKLKF